MMSVDPRGLKYMEQSGCRNSHTAVSHAWKYPTELHGLSAEQILCHSTVTIQ